MNNDYYEILQVHPKADQAAIEAAHQRLRALYDPARLDGAADELVALARRKRDEIERAYAVLGDIERRAMYDTEQSVQIEAIAVYEDDGEDVLDYRPLPPAVRSERPKGYDNRRVRVAGRAAPQQASGRAALIVVAALLVVAAIGAAVFLINGQSVGTLASVQPTAVPTASPLDQFEQDIVSAKQAAQQNVNDASAWVNYGNLVYNSVEIVREMQPDSQLYKQRVPRWLEATAAYSQALTLQPGNDAVRSDYGVSSCFYGASVGDQKFVASGLAAVQQAAAKLPNDPRVNLSLGHCLVSAQPPRIPEALESWLKVTEAQPNNAAYSQQAQQLIDQYKK